MAKRERYLAENLKTHSFETLKKDVRRRNVNIPLDVNEALRRIATWHPNLRYEVGQKSYEEAKCFLDAAKEVRDWVRRSV